MRYKYAEKLLKKHFPVGIKYIIDAGLLTQVLYIAQWYHEHEVKELKKKADDRDKNIGIDTGEADDTKPMLGSCAFPNHDIFISGSPSQTPLGSMEGAQKEKACPKCGNYMITFHCDSCHHEWN